LILQPFDQTAFVNQKIKNMPHVIVKMLSGRTDEQKQRLAEEITKVVMNITGNGEQSVSVSIEDIEQRDWTEKVYKPDIAGNWDKLYKKPGYNPLT
jgi:4-oxalocrotonate tautomerase